MSRYLFTKVFLSYSVDIFRHRFALQLFDAVRVCTGAGEVTGVGRTDERRRTPTTTTTARTAPRDEAIPTTWGRTRSTTPHTEYVTVRALENYL